MQRMAATVAPVTPEEVVRLLAAWSVRLVQFNGLVADRMGVTATDLQCLYELAHHGPSTAGALARRVNLTTGSASRMIDRLTAAGLVRRIPDPTDRRRVVVEPDPAALERIGALYDPLNARLAVDLDGADPSALAQMARFLVAAERTTEDEITRL